MRRRTPVLFLVLAGCAEARVPARDPAEAELLHRVLAAEDARGSSPDSLAPLQDGLASGSPDVRRLAVRGLGRLERAALVEEIAPLLADPDARVRAEAANALAQAVIDADVDGGAAAVRSLLLERLPSEPDAEVRGAIAQSLGRVRHPGAAEVATSAEAIGTHVEPSDPSDESATTGAVVRGVKGLHLLARQPVARGALPEAATRWLRGVARSEPAEGADALPSSRARSLAVATLAVAGQATEEDLDAASADPDPWVRREAVFAAAALPDPGTARRWLTRALEDPVAPVRYEAVRGWGRVGRDHDCAPIGGAARDADAHVALLAVDLLAGCPSLPGVADLLDSLVVALPGDGTEWHRSAHALVSLAAIDPERAVERLLPFVTSDDPFVRAWAARSAAEARQPQTLRLLARDPDPNVRVAALEGLAPLDGRDTDDLLVEQLGADDPQLLMTTARLLEGTEHPEARQALLDALARVTLARRETSRDARVALLEGLAELGSAADTARVAPLLRDFDPAVAARAADVLAYWTGTRPEPSPEPLPSAPAPSPTTLDSLAASRFTVEMADGGAFELRLFAWDAPTNAHRFARLAESGYYDGLTYHRVVPNFVVQGGSPAANEYAGDGPFTRDELGLDGNWRGTVGLSTRGRDTGDAQMFVNLVDNVRLDHQYTVFAEVVDGMEVVDRIQEGARIERITRSGLTSRRR